MLHACPPRPPGPWHAQVANAERVVDVEVLVDYSLIFKLSTSDTGKRGFHDGFWEDTKTCVRVFGSRFNSLALPHARLARGVHTVGRPCGEAKGVDFTAVHICKIARSGQSPRAP